jgi:uncharacterized protein YdeI (YjbR/CyaY-like superfamily)
MRSVSARLLFFATPEDFRKWLGKNHATASELWVGFYKKSSGRQSITWPESVDEALCFGWIDGLRKSIDANSYEIRFTPRKPRSNWSAVNILRIQELAREGRMHPAGIRAFTQRAPERSGVYAYENRKSAVLSKAAEKQFRSNRPAWEFFQKQPASYRQTAIWWVVSAKRTETQKRRLETLIADSKAARRVGPLRHPGDQ